MSCLFLGSLNNSQELWSRFGWVYEGAYTHQIREVFKTIMSLQDVPANTLFDDALRQFRRRAYMTMGFASGPFLLPFVFYGMFVQSDFLHSLMVLLVLLVINLNSYLILTRDRVLIEYRYFYVAVLAVQVWSIPYEGSYALVWCFPIALTTLFTDTRQRVRAMLILSLLTLGPTALWFLDMAAASRFVVSYAMVVLCSDLLLGLLEKMQKELNSMVIKDPLTGAYNRRMLSGMLKDAVGLSKRGAVEHSLIAIDIDNFKQINDSYGHDAGDRVLKGVVELISQRIRESDALFRVGGEEFILLVRDISLDHTGVLAESIREKIEAAGLLPDKPVTISAGVAHHTGREDVQRWLKRVDDNLYVAKRDGRNRVCGAGSIVRQSVTIAPTPQFHVIG